MDREQYKYDIFQLIALKTIIETIQLVAQERRESLRNQDIAVSRASEENKNRFKEKQCFCSSVFGTDLDDFDRKLNHFEYANKPLLFFIKKVSFLFLKKINIFQH